jgi:molecular chaperone DnaK (HSP70)
VNELKNNGFYLDSGEYIFDIDNSGWFGTDYCFKPNKKFPYTCNVVFNKNECERVAFEFPKIKKIEIDSCENIADELRKKQIRLFEIRVEKVRKEISQIYDQDKRNAFNQQLKFINSINDLFSLENDILLEIEEQKKNLKRNNAIKISQLASKIEEIKDETKKEEFNNELTRIKKMPAQNYSPDEVAVALNNLEQDILAQQQKETEEAKPHRQTSLQGSFGTESTQMTPEASSLNDLVWKFQCECPDNNNVFCGEKFNGVKFTKSGCEKYKKEAEETGLKCKCIYTNNNK